MMTLNDIRLLMRWWARWNCSSGGYPSACSIGRARDSRGGSVFGSRPPKDTDVSEPVRMVQVALASLEASGRGNNAAVLKVWYLRSHRATLEQVASALDMTPDAFRARLRTGEEKMLFHVSAATQGVDRSTSFR